MKGNKANDVQVRMLSDLGIYKAYLATGVIL